MYKARKCLAVSLVSLWLSDRLSHGPAQKLNIRANPSVSCGTTESKTCHQCAAKAGNLQHSTWFLPPSM
eukprot:6008631-Amphidinium_carterae.3